MADGTAQLSLRRDPDGGLAIVLRGRWRAPRGIPHGGEVRAAIEARPALVRFETTDLESWDSALVAYVAGIGELAERMHVPVDRSGLPGGMRRLLRLAEAGPVREPPAREHRPSVLTRIGLATGRKARTALRALALVGESATALFRMAVGRARFRKRELFLLIQLAGADALGIVGLVAFLVGLIVAFVGSVQLQNVGATIFIANLVGIAMVRELGALMAGIVVAGRTGAAYAAELGTMRFTQELDAFVTLGISPTEFLVAPRILALTLMLPFLCVYADLMGVVGGAVVGIGMMGLSPRVYLDQTIDAISTRHLLGGVFKAAVYGALVAGAGCFEGLRAGRSASAIGLAATAAVVDGIVLVIAASGLFAWLFNVLGI